MKPGKHGMRGHFEVEDINTEAARMRELGRRGERASPIPHTGWLSTCRDPQGNEFGLWQNELTALAESGS
jgi:predicted enzyme related to lactoylglutathione lyase